LHRVADDTRSLRAANPRLNVAESIFEGRRAADSIFGDVAETSSTIDGTEFDFDDIIVNSKAYRRALMAAQAKVKTPPSESRRDDTSRDETVQWGSPARRRDTEISSSTEARRPEPSSGLHSLAEGERMIPDFFHRANVESSRRNYTDDRLRGLHQLGPKPETATNGHESPESDPLETDPKIQEPYGVRSINERLERVRLGVSGLSNHQSGPHIRAVTPNFNVKRKEVPKTLMEAATLNTDADDSSAPSFGQNQATYELPQITVTSIPSVVRWPPAFPKLPNPLPSASRVPPTDEEKGRILEAARLPVLESNDPEMQVAWASDALDWLHTCHQLEKTIGAASSVNQSLIEVDAKSIVNHLARQGHPRARFVQGTWSEFGMVGEDINKPVAFRLYKLALSAGYARAAYRMGMMYETSDDKDIIAAIQHYHKGVIKDDAASCYVRSTLVPFDT
jgi:hypothetical protein